MPIKNYTTKIDIYTSLSEITGLPIVMALQESCGESACADVCEDFGEKGCVGCPVQAAISKLYEIEHPQPLTLEQLRERDGRPVWYIEDDFQMPGVTYVDSRKRVCFKGVYDGTLCDWYCDRRKHPGHWYDYPPKEAQP